MIRWISALDRVGWQTISAAMASMSIWVGSCQATSSWAGIGLIPTSTTSGWLETWVAAEHCSSLMSTAVSAVIGCTRMVASLRRSAAEPAAADGGLHDCANHRLERLN